MGDISELRGIVVVGTFLTVAILLIAWIPTEFYVSSETYLQVEPPSVFDAIDIVQYAETHNFTLYDGFAESWGKADFGHDMRIVASATYGIYNTHFWGFALWNFHQMDWINRDGINRNQFLSLAEIEADFDSDTNTSEYKVECDHFYMYAWFSYNTTTYSGFTDAFNNNEGLVLFAIDFDQVGTTWNAWSLVSGLLLFDLPNINFYMTALLSVPLWLAIAYITAIILMRILGALFGGGA